MSLRVATAARLREFFAAIPEKTLGRFIAEIEHASSVGEPDPLATTILAEARKYARAKGINLKRGPVPMRALCETIEPFLVSEVHGPKQPARIHRASLTRVWRWIERDLLPKTYAEHEEAIRNVLIGDDEDEIQAQLRQTRIVIANAIYDIVKVAENSRGTRMRMAAQIGGEQAFDDARDVADIFLGEAQLQAFGRRLPDRFSEFAPDDVDWCLPLLDELNSEQPRLVPFAVALIMARLSKPAQIARIPVRCVGSDDTTKIETHRYRCAIDLIIFDIGSKVREILAALEHDRDANLLHRLMREYSDLVRGMRLDLSIGANTGPADRLGGHCSMLSEALASEIKQAPRLVRACIGAGSKGGAPDEIDILEAELALNLLNDCRSIVSELALNDLVSRMRREIDQLLTAAGDAVVHKLRSNDEAERERAHRRFKTIVRLTRKGIDKKNAELLERSGLTAMATAERDVRAKAANGEPG